MNNKKKKTRKMPGHTILWVQITNAAAESLTELADLAGDGSRKAYIEKMLTKRAGVKTVK